MFLIVSFILIILILFFFLLYFIKITDNSEKTITINKKISYISEPKFSINSKDQKILEEFLEKKNFRLKKIYNVNVYENKFKFSEILKLFEYKNDKDLLIEKQFLVFEKVIF